MATNSTTQGLTEPPLSSTTLLSPAFDSTQSLPDTAVTTPSTGIVITTDLTTDVSTADNTSPQVSSSDTNTAMSTTSPAASPTGATGSTPGSPSQAPSSPPSNSTPAQSPTSETPTSPTTAPSPTTATQAPSPTTPSAPTTPTSDTPTSSTTSQQTTTAPSPSTTPAPVSSTAVTVITTESGGSTIFVTTTSTMVAFPTSAPTSSTSTGSGPGLGSGESGSGSSGLTSQGVIAVAVVVPVVGVALIIIAALFFWRRRRQRIDAEEERRKEVEDYSYNPNNDPTIPDVSSSAGAYELKDDTTSGYRGWGSTTVGSTGRKASTTMSGGVGGVAYSDVSHGRRDQSDNFSEGPLMGDGSRSPEGEILGAMGPSAAENRSNVHRGPSNASSSYSAAGRSDASGENGQGVQYGGYYDGYGNPYGSSGPNQQGPVEAPGQPIIRDNPARRNTRIENPSHFPQQSAGISQNF